MTGWIALSGSVVLGSCAQILLKRGLRRDGLEHDLNPPRRRVGPALLASPWVLGWALCFAAATGLWFVALAHMQVSYAYPLLGSSYVLVVLLAAVFLGETIPVRRRFAIALIAIGVVVAGRSF